jgi:DNA-binding MarR family transcriptional regulator
MAVNRSNSGETEASRTSLRDPRLFLREDQLDAGADQVLAAAQSLMALARREIAGAASSEPAFAVLFALRSTADSKVAMPDVGALSRRLAMPRPTLMRTLRELETSGLIERRVDPVDARKRRVRLTAAGSAHVAAANAAIRTRVAEAFRKAGPDVIGGALGFLANLSEPQPLGGPKPIRASRP